MVPSVLPALTGGWGQDSVDSVDSVEWLPPKCPRTSPHVSRVPDHRALLPPSPSPVFSALVSTPNLLPGVAGWA